MEFRCRPDCGLCCFATPAADRSEQRALLTILPSLPLLDGPGEYRRIALQGEGGACSVLHGLRCTAHGARPFPCRSYPLSVHIGDRIQATVVLSCPGLVLAGDAQGAPAAPAPIGLDDEIASVLQELGRPLAQSSVIRAARDYARAIDRLDAEARWVDPMSLLDERATLVDRALRSAAQLDPLPDLEEGLDALPVTFDPELGRLALGGSEAGSAVVYPLDERGGTPAPLGEYAIPDLPRLDQQATALLRWYLLYASGRDLLIGQAAHDLLDGGDGDLEDALAREIEGMRNAVVTRAALLRSVHGDPSGILDRSAVDAGIRATDAEFIDRPSIGGTL